MPGLTVTEKEHWKDRIGKKIEAIYAEDANLKERIGREARTKALDSLSLTELDSEMHEIEYEESRWEKRKDALNQEILAVARGVAVEDLAEHCSGRYYGARYESEVDQAIERRVNIHIFWTRSGWQLPRFRSDPSGRKLPNCWTTIKRNCNATL